MYSRNDGGKLRIGVLGGTFDPVHFGHLKLAEAAMEEFGLDKVILMPTGRSYFKDGRRDEVTPASARLQMAGLAVEGHPGLAVSDLEILRGGPTYTADTAEALAAQYPGAERFLIVGEDSVLEMHLWHEPERIFRCMTVLAAVRTPRCEPVYGELRQNSSERPLSAKCGAAEALRAAIADLEAKYGADIRVLSMPPEEISSTEIREKLRRGGLLTGLVPEAVEKYIRENGLYGLQ